MGDHQVIPFRRLSFAGLNPNGVGAVYAQAHPTTVIPVQKGLRSIDHNLAGCVLRMTEFARDSRAWLIHAMSLASIFTEINPSSLSEATRTITFLAMSQVLQVPMPSEIEVFLIDGNPWQADEVESPHVHRGTEWNVVVQGQAQRMVGSEVHHLVPGALLHVPPGTPHGMVQSSANLKFWVIWVPGDRGLLAESGARLIGDQQFSDVVALCRMRRDYRTAPGTMDPLTEGLVGLLQHAWTAAQGVSRRQTALVGEKAVDYFHRSQAGWCFLKSSLPTLD